MRSFSRSSATPERQTSSGICVKNVIFLCFFGYFRESVNRALVEAIFTVWRLIGETDGPLLQAIPETKQSQQYSGTAPF